MPNGKLNFTSENIGDTFAQAGVCQLYFSYRADPSAIPLYQKVAQQDVLGLKSTNVADMTETGSPFFGYIKTEHYAEKDWSEDVRANGEKIYAVVGDEDGLFSSAEIERTKKLLPHGHLTVISGASHDVFIHQQNKFLDYIESLY